MEQITVRCYAELNDFLTQEFRFRSFDCTIDSPSNIADILTLLNIPLQNVELVFLNGHSVGITKKVFDGDRLTLYPVFESFDISSLNLVHPSPLRHNRFILDVHLGKLASHLRMLGFDSLYSNKYTTTALVSISISENRILLSKSKNLLTTESLTRGHRIVNANPREQLLEVIHRFDLWHSFSPFTRCIDCNSLVQNIPKNTIIDRIPDAVRAWCNDFQYCEYCDRIYWKGSHYTHMQNFIDELVQEGSSL